LKILADRGVDATDRVDSEGKTGSTYLIYPCPCAFREYNNSWGRYENNAAALEKKKR